MRAEERHEQVCHPGSDVDAIGDVSDRHLRRLPVRPQPTPHTAAFLAVTARDPVQARRKADGCDRHVETVVVERRMMPEVKPVFTAQAHLLPDRARALLHLLQRERIVPGRYGRMGREDACRTHRTERVVKRCPAGHKFPHPLDQHEGGVPFVGVPDGRVVPQGAQHPHAPHPKDPFLPHPHVGPAGIQPVRQLAIGRVVRLVVCVQKKDRHAAHHDAPDPDAHLPARHQDRRKARIAPRPEDLLQRCRREVDAFVGVFLPPVEAQPLIGVSFGVKQAYAHQGNAEV